MTELLLAKLSCDKTDYSGGYSFTPQITYPLTVTFKPNYWSIEWHIGDAGYIPVKIKNVKNQLK
tara:strand:+ start:489 stop:680 length:192 start_codon:yes stop_codon:yes gene_type:complete